MSVGTFKCDTVLIHERFFLVIARGDLHFPERIDAFPRKYDNVFHAFMFFAFHIRFDHRLLFEISQ